MAVMELWRRRDLEGATAAGNYMAMPFRQNAKKYVHVMLWDNTQAAVVNTSVSIGIDYVEL